MRKLRLLFVIDHLGGGGAEAQLVELVNKLNTEEFEVILHLTEGGGLRVADLSPDIKIAGFLDEPKRRTIRSLIQLRKTLKSVKPDIVISWLEYSTFITSLCMSGFRCPHIAGIWGNLNYIYRHEVKLGWLKLVLLKFTYRQVDRVVINSYNLAKRSSWLKVKNISVIYNPLDISRIDQLPPKQEIRNFLKLKENLFYICFIGSLVKRKGIHLLLEGFTMIKDKNARLLILGMGPLEKVVRNAANNDNRIMFLGYQKNAVIYLKASDIFILPTFSEGLPNVIIEALACETPIIATKVDGIPEIIKHKINGLLIEPGSSEAIRGALEYAIENYNEMRLFAVEGKKVLRLFDKKKITSEFENLFKQYYR